MDEHIESLIRQLTLEEKVSLCSGADNWHTRAIERLGIPAIRVTDGPHGVRRPYEDDNGSWPATSFPTAAAMAATWNEDLVKEVGAALGVETRTKGCDILLGPAVNIHRAPLCGRNFEYFSEDPYLAGRMAVAWIQGIQSQNVGASLKHFAANNSEFERLTISSDVDERALREIYLPAFETAVKEAQPWTVMCSYNKVNGTWASENQTLLTEILKEEWGFEGFVVSDWGAVHRREQSANAGLDLEMPGMGALPVELLVDAVQRGAVSETLIDDKVRRILRIVFKARSDGLERKLEPEAANTPAHRQLARRAAAEAVVLLKNEGGVLPLLPEKIKRIAVFGPTVATARIQGGGSAYVNPYYTVSPLDGIRQRAGSSMQVDYRIGCHNNVHPPLLGGELVHVPGSPSEAGFRVEYFDAPDFSGQPFQARVEREARFVPRSVPAERRSGQQVIRWQAEFTPPVSGSYTFSLMAGGTARLLINGQMVVDHWTDLNIHQFHASWPFRSKYGSIDLQAGQPVNLVIEFVGVHRMNAGCQVALASDEHERVSQLAAQADVALVFVGTTEDHETEGFDRPDWALPGEQAALIQRVAAANPRTVVVLTNGAPLAMADWAGSVAGILEGWFAGQEGGNAIADVLFGDVNPSGKLPDSLPVRFEHNPSYLNFPGENGHLLYGESIFVGYRYYDAKHIEPLYPFGFGLSYTQFEIGNLRLSQSEIGLDDTLEVQVAVRNVGQRAGQEVVQLYVRDPHSRLVRPPKELKGFRKVALAPGQEQTVTFTLTRRDLSYYDPSVKDWVAEAGDFEVLVGASARDIHAQAGFKLVIPPAPAPRLTVRARVDEILADAGGRAVLEKHIPHLLCHEQFEHVQHSSLSWLSLNYRDIISEETLAAIDVDLALL